MGYRCSLKKFLYYISLKTISLQISLVYRGGSFDSLGEAMVFCEENIVFQKNGKYTVCSATCGKK